MMAKVYVLYLGEGTYHDPAFEDYVVTTTFSPFPSDMECVHTISLYPSEEFKSAYDTNKPIVYTVVVMALFLVTAGVFFLYDLLVERRQDKVMTTAKRSRALVTSLFPTQVADQLMENVETDDEKKKKSSKPVMMGNMTPPAAFGPNAGVGDVRMVPLGGESAMAKRASKPIAELFPSATVLFADIGKIDCLCKCNGFLNANSMLMFSLFPFPQP